MTTGVSAEKVHRPRASAKAMTELIGGAQPTAWRIPAALAFAVWRGGQRQTVYAIDTD